MVLISKLFRWNFLYTAKFKLLENPVQYIGLEFLYKMMTENVILFLKIPDNLRLTVFDLNGTKCLNNAA